MNRPPPFACWVWGCVKIAVRLRFYEDNVLCKKWSLHLFFVLRPTSVLKTAVSEAVRGACIYFLCCNLKHWRDHVSWSCAWRDCIHSEKLRARRLRPIDSALNALKRSGEARPPAYPTPPLRSHTPHTAKTRSRNLILHCSFVDIQHPHRHPAASSSGGCLYFLRFCYCVHRLALLPHEICHYHRKCCLYSRVYRQPGIFVSVVYIAEYTI